MAATSPDPACNYTDMWSSQPNQTCSTHDFSHLVASSTLFSSSSPISLFLIQNPTIIKEQYVKLSIPIAILWWWRVGNEYSIHRVQHTTNTAYTKYGIHPKLVVVSLFSWLRVNPWMLLQLLVSLPIQSTAISQLAIRAQRYSHLVIFPCWGVN